MGSKNLSPKPSEPALGSRWRHFKGTEYTVIRLSRDCEDPSRFLVIYEDEDGESWTRERSNFLGIHENGQKRFTEMGIVDIEKAIKIGEACREKKLKEERERIEEEKVLAAAKQSEELKKMRLEALDSLSKLEERIATVVTYGETKVNVRVSPYRIETPSNGKWEMPMSWNITIEEYAKQGIKLKVLRDSYEDNDINSEGGNRGYWTVYYVYLGVDLKDCKI